MHSVEIVLERHNAGLAVVIVIVTLSGSAQTRRSYRTDWPAHANMLVPVTALVLLKVVLNNAPDHAVAGPLSSKRCPVVRRLRNLLVDVRRHKIKWPVQVFGTRFVDLFDATVTTQGFKLRAPKST